ncbi:MAG: hypothetical protein WCP28_07250, partial [Actinomycetes bacterium]
GAQGAGKTTLIRQIYDLPPDTMPANPGLGERTPIVVKETDGVTAPVLWIRKLNKDSGRAGHIIKVEAGAAEWVAAQSRDADPTTVIVGIDVPTTFFRAEGCGFLLLPGYQLLDRSNDVWQTRMRSALIGSRACLVVTNQSLMATADQEMLIDDLRTTYLDNVDPVIAVTHTEMITDDDHRRALKRQAVETFDSRVAPEDVVLTGTGQVGRAAWVAELRARLVDSRGAKPGLRATQLLSLRDTVARDLGVLLADVRSQITTSEPRSGDGEYAEFLGGLDDANQRAREDFEKHLVKLLNGQFSEAKKRVDRYLAKHSGTSHSGNKLLDWIRGKSDVRKNEWEKQILKCWADASPDTAARANSVGTVEVKVVSRALPVVGRQGSGGQALTATGTSGALLASGALAELIPQDVAQGLAFILGGVDGPEKPSDKTFMTSCELLPAVGLEYIQFGLELAASFPSLSKDPAKAPTKDQIVSVLQEITANRRVLLQGAILFLGADLAIDGNIDSIPALAGGVSRFLFGSTAATGVAAAVSTTIAVGLVGGAIAAAIIAAANRDAADTRQRSYAILRGTHDHTLDQMMKQYDEIAEFLRDRLRSRMRGYLNVDEGFARALDRKHTVAECQTARDDLLTSIGDCLGLA